LKLEKKFNNELNQKDDNNSRKNSLGPENNIKNILPNYEDIFN